MNRSSNTSIGLQGGSSLIVIFGVLCLVVFSVLSLSSALAGGRLEEASVDATTAYYEADCRAEEQIAVLRQEKNNGTHSFCIPVSENETLNVEVLIEGDEYRILSWQTNYTLPWEADNSLPVWDGEN